jgi:hypothetical protein
MKTCLRVGVLWSQLAQDEDYPVSGGLHQRADRECNISYFVKSTKYTECQAFCLQLSELAPPPPHPLIPSPPIRTKRQTTE